MSDELNNDLINTNTNIDESQIEEHDITMIDDSNNNNDTPDLSQQHPYLNGHMNLPIISNIGDSFDHLEYDSRLTYIADSNEINVLWTDIQPIIKDLVIKQCDIMVEKINDTSVISTISDTKISILHCIDQHTRIPFTIQRICELITSPSKHYNSFIKYLNAVHKVLSVVSSWDTFPETTPAVNGINSNFLFANYDFAEVKYTSIKNDDDLEDDDDTNMETDENKNMDQDNTNDDDELNGSNNDNNENNNQDNNNNNDNDNDNDQNEDNSENSINNNNNEEEDINNDQSEDNDNNSTDEKKKAEETSEADNTSE